MKPTFFFAFFEWEKNSVRPPAVVKEKETKEKPSLAAGGGPL